MKMRSDKDFKEMNDTVDRVGSMLAVFIVISIIFITGYVVFA